MTDAKLVGLTRPEMAARAALDIPDGSYVNLGIGIPEMVAGYVPEGREVIYHTENGLLGMGPEPEPGTGEPELINAGRRQVTANPGAARRGDRRSRRRPSRRRRRLVGTLGVIGDSSASLL